VATHEGAVVDEDPVFDGDQAYVTMSLVSTYDGRVLWHLRQSLDVELDDPRDVERFTRQIVDGIPPSLARPGAEPTPPAVPAATSGAVQPPP
jgi:hypothetical protein